MADQIQELKFQVGEAWKGVYDNATAYSLAAVVQDPTGLSVYRSLKSGNVGHPVTDSAWWFRIIDMSSIKTESDRIKALNDAISEDEALRVAAEELRQQKEAERIASETQRNEDEQARISAEQNRATKESQREAHEQQRISAEQGRVTAESARVQAEQARVLAETLRANAEDQRAANEQNRIATEQQRIAAEQQRETKEAERQATFEHAEEERQQAFEQNEEQRDAEAAALQTKLENGEVVPALADNLASWAEDDTPVSNVFSDTIRTTAGDDPIVTSEGGTLTSIEATSDFRCDALIATAENLLRLKTNGGGAVAIGSGWYFPVPELTLGQFGDATENNGLILVDADGHNIQDATVRFKPLADGVPTSVTDGSVCASQMVTYQEKQYKVYTTDGAGWLIVSGVTYADTCARIAWEDWYDKFVSPTDPDDVGGSVNLAPLFATAPNGTGMFLVCGSVATKADRINADQWLITDPVGRIASPVWINTEVPPSQEGGESSWLHELTISGMAGGGNVLLEGSSQMLTVSGNTVSYTDDQPTAISGAVRYELATPATANVAIQSHYTLNDVGVEMKDGAEGTADFTISYMQNVADALSQIAKYKVGEIQRDLENLTEQTATDTAVMQEQIAALQSIVGGLNGAEGYVRIAGSSDPQLSYKSYQYDEASGFGRESVFALFYPCLVGTKLTGDDAQVGKIRCRLQKLGATTVGGVPMWMGTDGVAHAIDGSEGDVMIVNVEAYYRIMGKHTIEGTEYDVFLVSRTPFTWHGIEAAKVEKGGVSPDYCVSHTDTDGVQRMHSVYNPAWAGSYSAPVGVVGKFIYAQDGDGNITETYDADATLLGGSGGLSTTNLSLPAGEQHAMNHNPDTTLMVPFANQTAACVEDWFALMLAEGGTFDAHNAALMGSGFSANDPATAAADWEESATGAKNGIRIYDKDGAAKLYSPASNAETNIGLKGTSDKLFGTIVNAYRNPFHIMEAHRAVSYAVQKGIGELEWFAFEGNLYKWRSVEGFAGPDKGEMTCVVWKMLSSKLGAGCFDPTDKETSIEGNRIDLMFSVALFHGITTQASPSWWCTGMSTVQYNDGHYECYMQRDQAALIKSPSAVIDESAAYRFESAYKHIVSLTRGSGYSKDYSNDALMLPDTNANETGGGLHTYVGKFNYFTGTAPAEGKKAVRGFRRGHYVNGASLSPLYVYANYAPSNAATSFAFGTCCRIVG